MGSRLSREEFLALAEELLQDGPEVKYQNPDAWIVYLLKQKLKEKKSAKE